MLRLGVLLVLMIVLHPLTHTSFLFIWKELSILSKTTVNLNTCWKRRRTSRWRNLWEKLWLKKNLTNLLFTKESSMAIVFLMRDFDGSLQFEEKSWKRRILSTISKDGNSRLALRNSTICSMWPWEWFMFLSTTTWCPTWLSLYQCTWALRRFSSNDLAVKSEVVSVNRHPWMKTNEIT